MKKVKTKLKDLEVSKVDFVDIGADQKANVVIAKRGESEEEAKEPFYKKFFHSVCKGLGFDSSVIEKAMEAESFHDKMNERNIDKVREEIWNACYALQNSIASIIADQSADNKMDLIDESIDQFCDFAKKAAEKWADAETTEEVEKGISPDRFEVAKMHEMIEKSCGGKKTKTKKELDDDPEEKEEDEMGLDVTKMSPGEKAMYEELKKKYAVEDKPAEGTGANARQNNIQTDMKNEVAKAVAAAMTEVTKGLQTQIQAAFAPVQKRAEELEQAELAEIAKKYEILGTKPEQLVPVLKSMKDSSQEAYDSFISTMDAQVEAIEKSGLFSEIGKSGHNGSGTLGMSSNEAWETIEKKATELMQKETGLTQSQAIDRVCMANPALVHAYEGN